MYFIFLDAHPILDEAILDTVVPPPDEDDAILRQLPIDLAHPERLDLKMDWYLRHVIAYISQPEKVYLAKQILELLAERTFYYLQRSSYHKTLLPNRIYGATSKAVSAGDFELLGFFAQWLATYHFINGRAKHQEALLWTVETSIDERKNAGQFVSTSEDLRVSLNYRYIQLFHRLSENVYSRPYENLEQYRTHENVSLIEKMRIDLTLAIAGLVEGRWNEAIQKVFQVKEQLSNQANFLTLGIHRQDAIVRRYQYFADLLCSIGYLQQGDYKRATEYHQRVPQHDSTSKFIYHDLKILFDLQEGCLLHKAGQFNEALGKISDVQARLEKKKEQHFALPFYTHYALAGVFIDMEQFDMAEETLLKQLNSGNKPRNLWYATNFYYALAYSKFYLDKRILARQHLATAKDLHAKLNPSPISNSLHQMLCQAEQALEGDQPILSKPLMLIPPIVVI